MDSCKYNHSYCKIVDNKYTSLIKMKGTYFFSVTGMIDLTQDPFYINNHNRKL